MVRRKHGEFLDWSPADVIECLEVLPQVDEYEVAYHFFVEQRDLRLRLDVEVPCGDVQIVLSSKERLEDPLVEVRLFDCARIRYVKDPGHREALEFDAAPAHGGRCRDDEPIERGVRLIVKPSLAIRLF